MTRAAYAYHFQQILAFCQTFECCGAHLFQVHLSGAPARSCFVAHRLRLHRHSWGWALRVPLFSLFPPVHHCLEPQPHAFARVLFAFLSFPSLLSFPAFFSAEFLYQMLPLLL